MCRPQELSFSYVEMNASCTRSKNSLKEVVAESLNNTSIENFYKGQRLFILCFAYPVEASNKIKIKMLYALNSCIIILLVQKGTVRLS